MATKRKNIENLTIAERPLYFHIGRGGRYNNQGYVRFVDEKPFYELVDEELNYNVYIKRQDERGRFCKPYLADNNNGGIVSEDDINGLYGELNYDYDYNTDVVMSLEDVRDFKKYEEALKEAYKRGEVDEEIIKYLDLDVEEIDW